MENEIKVNEYIRTKRGIIDKAVKILDNYIFLKSNFFITEYGESCTFIKKTDVVKHSSNLIDLIECGDYVNGREVKHIADFEGIDKPIKKLIFVDKTHLIPGETAENEDIKTIVTKEQFESISYKVTKM